MACRIFSLSKNICGLSLVLMALAVVGFGVPQTAQAGKLRDMMERKRAEKESAATETAASSDAGYIHMQSKGKDRQYMLFTPAMGAKRESMPLVVVLHGTVGTGKKMREGLGFDNYARKYGFAVAYPDAFIGDDGKNTTRWNDGRDTLESTKLGIDDVTFIRDMIDDIASKTKIDRSRIFVTGPSNGGIMTYRLMCEASDLFAGAAPVIGNIAVSLAGNCNPKHPMAVLAINGTEDPFVPFNGGTVCKDINKRFCEGGEVISAEQSLGKMAQSFGCGATATHKMLEPAYPEDPKVEAVSYGTCADGKVVSAYWIHGGGHTWPPHAGQLGSKNGQPTKNLDATDVISKFFMSVK